MRGSRREPAATRPFTLAAAKSWLKRVVVRSGRAPGSASPVCRVEVVLVELIPVGGAGVVGPAVIGCRVLRGVLIPADAEVPRLSTSPAKGARWSRTVGQGPTTPSVIAVWSLPELRSVVPCGPRRRRWTARRGCWQDLCRPGSPVAGSSSPPPEVCL